MSNRVRERRRRRSIPPTRSSIFFLREIRKKNLFGGLISLSPLFSGSVPMNQPPFPFFAMLRSSVCEGKRSECRKDYNRDLYCVKVRRVSSQKKDFATESSYGCMSFSIPAPPRPHPQETLEKKEGRKQLLQEQQPLTYLPYSCFSSIILYYDRCVSPRSGERTCFQRFFFLFSIP